MTVFGANNLHPPAAYMKRKYNLTVARWKAIFKRQKGACPVCEREFSSVVKPCIDHDHKTKKVRGLLCRYCNHRVVGRHRDWRVVHRAAMYLKRYGS